MAPIAAAAFEETLASVEESLADDAPDFGPDPVELGHRAALLASAAFVWRGHLGPMLSGSEVRRLLGVGTRQAVSDLVKRGRLLALPGKSQGLVFPAFQFQESGRPYPEIASVIEALAGAELTPHSLASWFVSPQSLLDDRTPAEWLRSEGGGGLVVEAARRTAARLGR